MSSFSASSHDLCYFPRRRLLPLVIELEHEVAIFTKERCRWIRGRLIFVALACAVPVALVILLQIRGLDAYFGLIGTCLGVAVAICIRLCFKDPM